jgi:membrane fusion protein (multidrug efflux system)
MNGLVNPKTGTTEFRADFSNPQGLFSGSSGIIRLPIVQNDVIVIQKAVLKCRKTNCLRCWERKQSEIKNY